MENNAMNNHIRNNTVRGLERSLQRRADRDAIEKVLSSKCNDGDGSREICNHCEIKCKNEHGGEVFATNVSRMAYRNDSYRESVWTGDYLQMTVMSIARGGEIGVEMHGDTDQYIRIEHGSAIAMIGDNEKDLDKSYRLFSGDAIFIPAGYWHNIVNTGRCALKISSVYAPPHHPKCTVEKNK